MPQNSSDPPANRPESATDLRRRARRVRTIVADMGNDADARERLTDLARDLDARAAQIESAQRDVTPDS